MRPDPADKRAKLVTYTEHGRWIAGHGYEHLIDLEQRFADEFGPEDYATARKVLDRIAPLLDQWATNETEEAG
jgi:DNA-binding MarR family transcriptional regulator